MDSNVPDFGRLWGYPNVQQTGSRDYIEKVDVGDGAAQYGWRPSPYEDNISYIQQSNNIDNIDQADIILRNADPDALDKQSIQPDDDDSDVDYTKKHGGIFRYGVMPVLQMLLCFLLLILIAVGIGYMLFKPNTTSQPVVNQTT